jgi:hypothetical protein
MRLALILAALVVASAAVAQPTRHGADAVTWNVRAAIGELGWAAPDDAYAAIVEVHIRRAEMTGATTALMARRYSAAVRRPPRHRAWVRELRVSDSPPPSWPPHLDGVWWRHAERVEAVRSIVRDVLAGQRATACVDAVHYGGAMDSAPTGHVESCRWQIGRGSQVFYRRGRSSHRRPRCSPMARPHGLSRSR